MRRIEQDYGRAGQVSEADCGEGTKRRNCGHAELRAPLDIEPPSELQIAAAEAHAHTRPRRRGARAPLDPRTDGTECGNAVEGRALRIRPYGRGEVPHAGMAVQAGGAQATDTVRQVPRGRGPEAVETFRSEGVNYDSRRVRDRAYNDGV